MLAKRVMYLFKHWVRHLVHFESNQWSVLTSSTKNMDSSRFCCRCAVTFRTRRIQRNRTALVKAQQRSLKTTQVGSTGTLQVNILHEAVISKTRSLIRTKMTNLWKLNLRYKSLDVEKRMKLDGLHGLLFEPERISKSFWSPTYHGLISQE